MGRVELDVRRLTYHLSRVTRHAKALSYLGVLSLVLFLAISCTKGGEPSVHPEGWADRNSVNFHGSKVVSSGIQSCKRCHGESYLGGTSDVSCNSCHGGGPSGHPGLWSFINPDSSEYHGRIFWENGWDFGGCQRCHGEDLDQVGSSGGLVEYPCATCHQEGIGSCNTCHGASSGISYPPKDIFNRSDPTLISVGAHTTHMESSLAVISCNQCHVVPEDYRDEGHLGSDNTAEITFGITATDSGNVEPVWNRDDATCSAVYCHGNFDYNNILGNSATPVWTEPGRVVCGSCHGTPPTGHFGDYNLQQCSLCHSSAINSEGEIIDSTKHVNRMKDFN